jgi:hypothetical protein
MRIGVRCSLRKPSRQHPEIIGTINAADTSIIDARNDAKQIRYNSPGARPQNVRMGRTVGTWNEPAPEIVPV